MVLDPAPRPPPAALTAASTDAPIPGLTRRDFFADVRDRLRPALPAELSGFRHRQAPSLLKVFYDNDRVHFEVWANGAQGVLGVGLHFEDGPVSTAAYLAYFDAQIVELKHALGPTLELERWTPSWGHLYEIHPLTRLDAPTVTHTARRLAALIATLQPLVAAAAIPPERSASGEPVERSGPWRKWRR